MIEVNKIFNEDCLETMKRMDDNSIDLIVTSPPYNKNAYAAEGKTGDPVWDRLKGRKIGYDVYEDDMPQDMYEEWQRKVIKECLSVLKPHGSLFYNHKDIIVEGLIIAPKFVYDFPIHQQIIWDIGSSPALDKHYFFPITEYIYWIVKDPKNVYFDKDSSIFKKSIWRINAETNTLHPAPFPKVMVGNIIQCCSKEGDVVYDPYMGSGTTAMVARKLNRHFVGFELNPDYCKIIEKKIQVSGDLFY